MSLLKVPGLHRLQVDNPGTLEYVPGEQKVQFDEEGTSEMEPCEQVEHRVKPEVAPYWPAPHEVHED